MTWWVKELEECRRKGYEEGRAEAEARVLVERRVMLVRIARRKFDAGTASELGALLEEVSGAWRLTEVTDLIIDCATGQELLTKVATTAGAERACRV